MAQRLPHARFVYPFFLLSFFLFPGAWGAADAQEFLISSPAGGTAVDEPDVVFGGGQYFVVWTQAGNIYGSRVSPEASVLDPEGIKLPEYNPTFGGADLHPAVSFDGTNFVAAYQSSIFDYPCTFSHMRNLILAARVSAAGVVQDASAVAVDSMCSISGGILEPDLAFGGENFLGVWAYYGLFIGSYAKGAVLTPELGASVFQIGPVVGDDLAVSLADPAVAFDGSNFLTAWSDKGDLISYRIYGARVAPDGTVVGSSRFPLTAAGSADSAAPAVAFGSSVYLVAWTQAGSVRAARVSLEGTVLDPNGFVIGQGSGAAVSHDGANFLVVWAASSPSVAIYGATVTAAGEVGGAEPISTEGVTAQSPSVDFDGERFLVCWKRDAGGEVDIYGALVETSACTDLDGDGYGNPEDAACPHPEADCDDDPADDPAACPSQGGTCTCGQSACAGCAACIHPGAADFANDAWDSNCDGLEPGYPATANAAAAQYGSSSLTGSGLLNELALVLLPAGAVLLLRRSRRK